MTWRCANNPRAMRERRAVPERSVDFAMGLCAAIIVGVAFVAMVLGTMLAATHRARAHGDADWIRQRAYRNAVGEYCCGVRDCAPLADDDVSIRRSGFYIHSTKDTVPYNEATPTPAEGGGRYWLCVWAGTRKCFFAPPGTN